MRFIAAVMLVLVAGAQPAAADEKLHGVWEAVGQPGKTAEFRADGTFRYIYDPKPPHTVLQICWKKGWFGKLVLSQENGDGARSCSYKIEGDNLTLHDGGASCVPHRPVEMATRFTRVK